jgi:hypothetical protein
MLEQIETILKSNWSSVWFANNTFINPKFKNNEPMLNLNALADNLVLVLVARHSESASSQNNEPGSFANFFNETSNRKQRGLLRDLLVDRTNMPVYMYDELVYNTTLDRDQLYLMYMEEESATAGRQDASFDKAYRTAFLHRVFCNKAKFDRLVQVNLSKPKKDADKDKATMQAHFCNMTGKFSNFFVLTFFREKIVQSWHFLL